MLSKKKVDVVPELNRNIGHGKLIKFIDEFADSKDDFVEVIFTKEDYKNSESCVSALRGAIRRSKRRVRAQKYGDKVYLRKY